MKMNINLTSIELMNTQLASNDKIRISITTLPKKQKQAQTIEAKKLNIFQPNFKIEFKETTKKIIIVIRKKNYIEGDPIIATTTIYTEDIKNIFKEKNNSDYKKVNLYESNKNQEEKQIPQINGKAEISFTVNKEVINTKSKKNNNKESNKYKEFNKMNSVFKHENEYLLLDNDFTN